MNSREPDDWEEELRQLIKGFAVLNGLRPAQIFKFLLSYSASFVSPHADEEDVRELCRIYFLLINEFKQVGLESD